jgi:hypothetical protein
MDKEYLSSELKRIGQDRLISIDEFNKAIFEIINMDNDSGSVYRIDIREGMLWIDEI